ncbi:MAG TPA: RagB/SusD family nutrient uptake outer membrane protein [Puia sp.]|nr:RagB/SusD family nutrient uptake outer membrane protein [Puia sp.]
MKELIYDRHIAERFTLLAIAASALLSFAACKKLVAVDPPVTSITGENVYSSDATAISTLTALYTDMSLKDNHFNNGFPMISLYAGLSADELTLFDLSNATALAYYRNALTTNPPTGVETWSSCYPYIFICNSAIEALTKANALTPAVTQQLLGEARFMRAFFYFYLVNLYGDVPLPLTTDYKVNSLLPRTPASAVYAQVISDLRSAEDLLSADYLNGSLQKYASSEERVRPTKWAAAALLARAYLYTGKYDSAELAATSVINNTSLFSLTTLGNVFLKNSREAIWQLQPVTSGTTNTQDAYLFILPPSGPGPVNFVYLSDTLVNSFEPGDQRKSAWVGSDTVGGNVYHYAYKYKVNASNVPQSEYLMMFRLAEQYLIRAEARANQNNISGAQDDLNAVRARAGLPGTAATDKSGLLAGILHERQVELFTELGHRWLDLKRTGNIDAVMTIAAGKKDGSWSSDWQWYPIPLNEMLKDPNLTQNRGY